MIPKGAGRRMEGLSYSRDCAAWGLRQASGRRLRPFRGGKLTAGGPSPGIVSTETEAAGRSQPCPWGPGAESLLGPVWELGLR